MHGPFKDRSNLSRLYLRLIIGRGFFTCGKMFTFFYCISVFLAVTEARNRKQNICQALNLNGLFPSMLVRKSE